MYRTNKQLIWELKARGIKQRILEAIEKIDRRNFVPKEEKRDAYNDRPLSIGYKQTISQPYTVAFMLQNLELKLGNVVLEIGTGSGWNAALISYLLGEKGRVYTIERIKPLYEIAREKLKSYKNIEVIYGDALQEIKKYAPYDKIIFTAAIEKLDKYLTYQLKNNGSLIAPVGKRVSKMIKITKINNKLIEQDLGDFVFVPVKGGVE